jgi:5-methyltetrahydrofolate--homocysteine methyltransferase
VDPKTQVISDHIIDGKVDLIEADVQDALDAGISPEEILNVGMVSAMDEVGALFENGEYFVPEMLIAAHTMQTGLAILKPLLVEGGVEPAGSIVIGTVQGDLHDIGKNLVAMMLEGGGYQVVDLGTDVSPDTFLKAIREHAPNVVGLSALLTTTMQKMRETISVIEEAGLRDQAKIIVGGAPVTEAFATDIGADGYAPDASKAVSLAKDLIS